MRVLVTDGDSRAALAVTRSLGRGGHHVVVGEKRVPSLAHTSRYCAARVVYPDPASSSAAFVDQLADIVRTHEIDALIPVADIAAFLVTEHHERFEDRCAVPLAPAESLRRAADKVELWRTATRLGVGVPQSIVVEGPGCLPDEVTFPLVVKPWRSRIATPEGWIASAVSHAGNREELERDLAARRRQEFPVMLQERIDGPGVGVFACYHRGQVVAVFGHRRIVERPPWGGVSALSESVAVSPEAREAAIRLLDELGWHGVAMVEFKLDSKDGSPKLMEINGRFWGSLQLAVDAGVDFPALLLRTVGANEFGPQQPYQVGVRTRWFWGTVDSLLLTLFADRARTAKPLSARTRAMLDFMKLMGRRLHYDNPKWDDPAPFLFETTTWFRQAFS